MYCPEITEITQDSNGISIVKMSDERTYHLADLVELVACISCKTDNPGTKYLYKTVNPRIYLYGYIGESVPFYFMPYAETSKWDKLLEACEEGRDVTLEIEKSVGRRHAIEVKGDFVYFHGMKADHELDMLGPWVERDYEPMLLCVERSKCVSGFKEAVEIVKKHQLELEKGATSNYKGL